MTKPFTKLAIGTILISVVMLSINIVFGMNTVTYISKFQMHGIWYYKIDWFGYLENIRTTFTDVPHLNMDWANRTWQVPTNWLDIPTNWSILINDLAYIIDVLITPLNAICYGLRIAFYAIKMILALLGLPVVPGSYTGNPLEWLITMVNFMVYDFQIPYV